MGENFQSEVKVDLPEALILGSSTDGIGWFPKAKAILEIKSISEAGFSKLNSPKEEHIIQSMGIYATALDAPFVSLLYVSKAFGSPMKEFVLQYDSKIYKRWVRKKAQKVEESLELGHPPVADANKYECKDCGYSYFCPQSLSSKDRFRR